MDTEYRFSKIEEKYHVKVLNLIGDKLIHIKRDKYEYILPINNISRTKWTPSLMTEASLIQYLTDKINHVNLIVESINKSSRKMLVRNTETNESTWQPYCNTNSECLHKLTTRTTNLISKLKSLIGNKYDYSKVIYNGVNSPIIVGCPEHGDFITSYSKEASNKKYKGCPICAKEEYKRVAFGYRRSEFVSLCTSKNVLGKLYIIKCYSNNESFYKIGITSREVSQRIKNIPYKCEVIKIEEDIPDKIWNLEKCYHTVLKQFKYLPSKEFDGMFECFYTLNNLI